eukprot:GEMP01032891.1.p1 GENE.GEMP01032891.1~~GEMP01032891.1.p1  ORF type:complete len:198 (+),score=42.69 GEMP01032891.1:178-771(+)
MSSEPKEPKEPKDRIRFGGSELDCTYVRFLQEAGITEDEFSKQTPCEKAKLWREYINCAREVSAPEKQDPDDLWCDEMIDSQSPRIGEIVIIKPPGQALRVAGWLTATPGDRVCVTHKEFDKNGSEGVWLYGCKVASDGRIDNNPTEVDGRNENSRKGWFNATLAQRGPRDAPLVDVVNVSKDTREPLEGLAVDLLP